MGDRDIDRPARGELMDREDDNMPTVGGIFSRLWRLPFLNLQQQKKLASVRKVVQEEEGLWKDLVTHRQSFNRLRNVDHILAEDNATLKANAVAAQNRLAEEERKEKARKTGDRIFAENKRYEGAQSRMRNKYELKIQEAEYKKRLHPLEREVEDLQNPPPEPAAQPNKQKLREDAYKHFDKEVKRIDKMKNVTAERKTDLKDSARSDLEKELEKIDRMP
jgi:hypothetical protein